MLTVLEFKRLHDLSDKAFRRIRDDILLAYPDLTVGDLMVRRGSRAWELLRPDLWEAAIAKRPSATPTTPTTTATPTTTSLGFPSIVLPSVEVQQQSVDGSWLNVVSETVASRLAESQSSQSEAIAAIRYLDEQTGRLYDAKTLLRKRELEAFEVQCQLEAKVKVMMREKAEFEAMGKSYELENELAALRTRLGV
jgi:hypothetical protein